jgi:hypothetical protein
VKGLTLGAAVLCASVFAATARADAPPSLFAGAGVFVGVYRKYAAANYVPLLAGLGTRGFSVFLADQATAADYAALEPLAAAASG